MDDKRRRARSRNKHKTDDSVLIGVPDILQLDDLSEKDNLNI